MNMKKLKRLRAVLLLLCSFVAPITMLAQDLVIPVGETGNLPLNSNHVWASSDGSGRYTHWEIDNGSKQYIRILSQSVTSVTLQGVSPTLNTLALVRSTHIWTDPWGRSQSLTGAYYVKVSPNPPSIIISAKEVEMTVGETETISVTVNTYGVNYDDRWSVENGTDNVTLTDYGLYATVKAVKPGVSTVRYTLGSFPEAYGISCKITIKEAEKPKLTLSASPFGGEVTAGTQVYLSANVSGADIYYTLDGSTPSKNSSRYTSSGITINESCTLKAIAYKDGYETSEVLTQTYTVKINGVVINSTNFPDEIFRSYLLRQNYGIDGIITDDEISEIKEIEICRNIFDPDYEEVTTLTGIEHFFALEELNCSGNQLTGLNVSKNTKLRVLDCGHNQLTTLDVSKNTELKNLYCSNNQLTTLDVSKNTELRDLFCWSNQLTTLDVSKNTKLWEILCDINQLTTLDVSKNTELMILRCASNQLTTLDVSKNTELTWLTCGGNQLTTLDVSRNTKLSKLECYHSQLTTLDVSKNTELKTLNCYNNQLTTLDVSKNTKLRWLYCYVNCISEVAMGSLINSLPFSQNARFYVIDDDNSNEKNVCTKEQVKACKEKGWNPLHLVDGDWIDYEGSESTDIQHLYMDGMDMDNKTFYDLKGRRITKPTAKGLYIKNGKKIIFK